MPARSRASAALVAFMLGTGLLLGSTAVATAAPDAEDPLCVELAVAQDVLDDAEDKSEAAERRSATAKAEVDRLAADSAASDDAKAAADAELDAALEQARLDRQARTTAEIARNSIRLDVNQAGLDCTETEDPPVDPPVVNPPPVITPPVNPTPPGAPSRFEATRAIIAGLECGPNYNRDRGRIQDARFAGIDAGDLSSAQLGQLRDEEDAKVRQLNDCLTPSPPLTPGDPIPLGGSTPPTVDPSAPPVDQTADDGSGADVSGDQVTEVPVGSVDTGSWDR